MGRKSGQDLQKLAARRLQIVQAAFPVFAERTIEKVTMNDIADACGIGVATVYRCFSTKPALVLAVGTWVWTQYITEYRKGLDTTGLTAAEQLSLFLDSFLDLYRNHRDLLRFNQFFNIYVQSEGIPADQLSPYLEMIREVVQRTHGLFITGRQDGTLRGDVSERAMVSAILHLMLAAATRYAVGLVYTEGSDPEKELMLLRDMLLAWFTTTPERTE